MLRTNGMHSISNYHMLMSDLSRCNHLLLEELKRFSSPKLDTDVGILESRDLVILYDNIDCVMQEIIIENVLAKVFPRRLSIVEYHVCVSSFRVWYSSIDHPEFMYDLYARLTNTGKVMTKVIYRDDYYHYSRITSYEITRDSSVMGISCFKNI